MISKKYIKIYIFLNIYLCNSLKSFEDIDLWLKDVKENSSPNIKIFLIGNKSDLEDIREVDKEKAQKLKDEYDLDYFIETSAKTGKNAQEIFIQAAKVLYKDYNEYKKKKNIENNIAEINLNENKEENRDKNGCC